MLSGCMRIDYLQAYSLDWDKQYLEDEAKLRSSSGYGAGDVMLMPPLAPGAPLWANLPPPLAEAEPATPDAQSSAMPAAATEAGGVPAEQAGSNGIEALASQASMFPGFAMQQAAQDEPVVVPGGLNALVMGPARVGKSTQAALLAARYGVPLASVDDLVMVSRCSFDL